MFTICKGAAGAADGSFYQALPDNWQRKQALDLSNRQITAVPGNFNPSQLRDLFLKNNKIEAIPANFNPRRLQMLFLNNNRITDIPDALQLNELIRLDLSNNNIQEINPQRLLKQFPKLRRIDLSGNTDLDKRFIEDLRDEAQKAGRGEGLEIIARDIYAAPLGLDTKG